MVLPQAWSAPRSDTVAVLPILFFTATPDWSARDFWKTVPPPRSGAEPSSIVYGVELVSLCVLSELRMVNLSEIS